jgi:hypothetical protein
MRLKSQKVMLQNKKRRPAISQRLQEWMILLNLMRVNRSQQVANLENLMALQTVTAMMIRFQVVVWQARQAK